MSPMLLMGGAMAVVVLLSSVAVGISRYQLALCRTEVVEAEGRYDLLLSRVETQNAAVAALEQAGKEAAKRAAQERARAAGIIRTANAKAASLGASLAAPAKAATCEDGARVVRADLAAR